MYPTIRLFVTDSADLLADIRSHSGTPRTVGLSDSVIADFAARDATLSRAIAEAHEAHIALRAEVGGAIPSDPSLTHVTQSLRTSLPQPITPSGTNMS